MAILEKLKKKNILKSIGPGFITGSADDDPSGIATYSQTGAMYGLSLLWSALFMLPMLYVVQEMSARISFVTGKGISKVIKTYYNPMYVYIIVSILTVANIINIGVDLGAMANSVRLFIPINFYILIIFFTVLIISLEVFIAYKKYVNILKFLCFFLLAYVFTGFIIQPNWLNVLKATVVPSLQFSKSYLYIVVGLLGTTISPYMVFWQSSEEIEEEKKDKLITYRRGIPSVGKKLIKGIKLETFTGMLYSEIMTWFIIITSALTLNVHGITNITSSSQAASELLPLVHSFPNAGLLTELIFALGIIGTGLVAIPTLAGSISYAVSDAFNIKEGLEYKFKSAKRFYLIITIATVIGMAINFIHINSYQALIFSAFLNGVLNIPILIFITVIGNRKSILGGFTNSVFTNIVSVITILLVSLAFIFSVY